MDRAPKISDAFAVNDADLVDSASATFVDVFGDQLFYIFGVEIVQIENTVDGIFDWVVV